MEPRDAADRAADRARTAERRTQEIADRLTKMAAGQAPDPADVELAQERAAEARERAEESFDRALRGHERAARSHERAAHVHEEAARHGAGNADEHRRRAEAHRQEAHADLQQVAREREQHHRVEFGADDGPAGTSGRAP